MGTNGVKVLSYSQYCRFRSLQRRVLERARAPGLQDPHLLALGGVRALPNTRLMYCRDTFSHPSLESSAEFSWQFSECRGRRIISKVSKCFIVCLVHCPFGSAGCPSLSLRGRPRKRRSQDDRESPTSSQSESWMERMKVCFSSPDATESLSSILLFAIL